VGTYNGTRTGAGGSTTAGVSIWDNRNGALRMKDQNRRMRGNGMTILSTASEGVHGRLFALGLHGSRMSNPALTSPIDFTRFLPTKFTPPAPATPPTQNISLMSSQRELPLSPKSTRKLNAQRKVQPLTTRIYQLSSLTHNSRTGRLPGKSTTSSRSKQRYHLREPWARWPAVGVGDQEAVA
jgi:hypothetical protein